MSKLITTNEQLNALLPNIAVPVEGETPLIDKLAPFLVAAEKWVCDVFTSQPVFDTICSLAEDDSLRAATTQVVIYEAFRRALPHLDVILTPNGFGIVSNTNVAPASKERITRLLDTLLDNRDAAISQVLSLLCAETRWRDTEQAKFFRATMFPDTSLAERFPRSSESRWEQYINLRSRLIPIEEEIAVQFLSQPLMHELRGEVLSGHFLTDTHRHICRVLRAVEVDCLKSDNAHLTLSGKTHRTLTQLVEIVRSNPDLFPQWHYSDTAQLYNPPIFENKKESMGYWF